MIEVNWRASLSTAAAEIQLNHSEMFNVLGLLSHSLVEVTMSSLRGSIQQIVRQQSPVICLAPFRKNGFTYVQSEGVIDFLETSDLGGGWNRVKAVHVSPARDSGSTRARRRPGSMLEMAEATRH